MVKVAIYTPRYEPSFGNNNQINNNDDEWVDVDTINDIEIAESTNMIFREQGGRLYQQWKDTVRQFVAA